jgi:hypothetical protein
VVELRSRCSYGQRGELLKGEGHAFSDGEIAFEA